MAQFNLNDYETVSQRIDRFLRDHPNARITTENMTEPHDRAVLTWIVKAEVWLPYNNDDLEAGWYLKSTGHAFEIDGQGMANKTSALENCETSAIGRALANAGYGGDKRVTREEMEKVERGQTPIKPKRDFVAEAEQILNLNDLRKLYAEAQKAGATTPELAKIANIADALPGSEDSVSSPKGAKGTSRATTSK